MAYALYSRLLRAVKKAGVKYVVVKGAASRGHGAMGTIRSVLAHHTAGPKTGDHPSLNVVAYGRPGLSGPLSQFFLSRNGTVYIVAAGVSYHAGRVKSSAYQNSHALGIEAEATGTSSWPDVQMDAYAKLCKALIEEFDLPVGRVVGHKEACSPSGRKIDPNFNMSQFRGKIAGAKGGVSVSGGSTGGGGGKKYKVVSKTADLGLYDKDGNGHTRIKDWQKNALGYSDKEADGYFGPDTRDDTKELQLQIGLRGKDVDGMVGDTTLKAWEKAGKPKLKKKAKPKAKTTPFPLKSGHFYYTEDKRNTVHSGYYEKDRAAIRHIQRKVGASVDGIYGSDTKSKVKAAQKKAGLRGNDVDGAVGSVTWKKLGL